MSFWNFARRILRRQEGLRVLSAHRVRHAVAEPLESRRLLTSTYFYVAWPGRELGAEDGGYIAMGFECSGASEPFYEVNYRIGGSAQRDSDFTATNFEDGTEATGTVSVYLGGGGISIQPLLDNEVEGDETVEFELLPGEGYQVGFPPGLAEGNPEFYNYDPAKSELTITDNPVKVSISGGGAALNEADETEASFTVRRDGGDTTKELTATLNADGGEAQLGVDFTLTPQTVTFAANETVKAVAIKAKQDEIEGETNPEVAIIEVADGGTTYVAVPGEAKFTVADDDGGGGGGGGGGNPPSPPPPGPQPPPPPPQDGDTPVDDYIDLSGGFGGESEPQPDGPDEGTDPDPGGSGSSDGGPGLSTGGLLWLNDDFDEQNRAGGQLQPDNDTRFTKPGIVWGDGEVAPLYLGMSSNGYGREGKFTINWNGSKVKVWTWEPVNKDDPNTTYRFVEKKSGWSEEVDFSNYVSWVGSGWGVQAWVEGITASSSIDDVAFNASFTPTDDRGGSPVRTKRG